MLLETSCLRDNIWKEHLEIVNRNIKAGQTSCYIFEIGNVFQKKTEFIQEEVLNGAIYGNKKFGKWINSGKDNDLNYYQARGKLKEALSSLNIKIDDKPTDSIDFLHPGRTAKLIIEGQDADDSADITIRGAHPGHRLGAEVGHLSTCSPRFLLFSKPSRPLRRDPEEVPLGQ